MPRVHQFAIGEQVGSSDTLIGVLERLNAPLQDVILGLLINEGPASFTFSLSTGRAATGSIAFAGQPADGNNIVIDDGTNAAVTFEFDNNASVTQSATLRQVLIGATLPQTVGNLVAAIKNAPALDITPLEPFKLAASTDCSFRLVHDKNGTAGNVAITKTGTNITVTGMTGGTGAAKNIRVNAASVASVVVKPQTRVPFLIEIGSSDVQDFYNFLAVPTAGSAAFGFLSLMMVNGDFNARQRYAYI
jgi:hypothetical protein